MTPNEPMIMHFILHINNMYRCTCKFTEFESVLKFQLKSFTLPKKVSKYFMIDLTYSHSRGV